MIEVIAPEVIGPPGAAATSRQHDFNGWYEIKNNPLSRVGVFPYLGKQLPGAPDPDKVYMVYRPEEELADLGAIESFKLLPWVDEHKMLGSTEAGLTPPEQKGIHGVIGEEVYFQGGMLYGNVKVFSESLAQLIDEGKKELSAGYRCRYEWKSGIWNGQRYDAIQRHIRGNHLALVKEGRMGPEVSVLDHLTFALDTKELKMADKTEEKKGAGDEGGEENSEMTLAQASAMLKELVPQVKAINEAMAAMTSKGDGTGGTMDAEKEKEEKEKDDKAEDAEGDKDKDGKAEDGKTVAAMDAKITDLSAQLADMKANGMKTLLGEIAQRDGLVQQLTPHIGTFDHAEKTLEQVAAYGVEKLGLKGVAKGTERAALQGFMHNRPAPSKQRGFAMDEAAMKSGRNPVDSYLTGGTTQH